MESQKNPFFQKINNPKLYVFYAMLLTAITYLLTLTYLDILGYGNNTILQSDLAGQYISFLQMFKRLLLGEESLWYTFTEYLGSGAILTYAYYTLNPFNLLFLIPNVSPTTIVLIIIILKITLIGGSMEFFLLKGLKLNSPATILFAMCYALNGFVATMYYNLMWLDAIYMVPIIVYLIMKYVKTRKWLGLVPAYAYLFITNFYMAYMVGIFSALIFLLYLLYSTNFTENKILIWKRLLRKGLTLVFAVCLSAGLCAAILLPCAYFLYDHTAADNFSFSGLSAFIPELINSLFIGQSGSIDNSLPFLYSGLPTLLLVPFFFLDKKRPLKIKLYVGILLLFYFIACTLLPLYEFMHAFDYPNFYAYRFSYIIAFILVCLATKTFEETAFSTFKPFAYYVAGLIVLYSSLIPIKALFRQSENVNTSVLLCLNCLGLLLWATLIYFSSHKTTKRKLLYFLALPLLIIELSSNGYLCAFKGSMLLPEDEYDAWINIEGRDVETVKYGENEFYRIIITEDQQYNSGCYFDVACYNTFSSSDDYSLRMLLKNLGYATCNRSIESFGSTPVTNMLFGTKYTVNVPVDEDSRVEDPQCSIEENPYALPIAYMVSPYIESYESTDNPFENQIRLLYALTGEIYDIYDNADDVMTLSGNIELIDDGDQQIFHRISSAGGQSRFYYYVPHSEDKTFMMAFPVDTPTYNGSSPVLQGIAQGTNRYLYLSQGSIVTAKTITKNLDTPFDRIGIVFNDETSDYACEHILSAYYINDSIEPAYEYLSSNPFTITSFKDDRIEGTVVSTGEKPVLFTSIPYDKCWKATVDGEPATVYPILEDAFCGLVLPEGEHKIVLEYQAKGANEGSIISLVSVSIYLCLILYTLLAKTRKVQHKK